MNAMLTGWPVEALHAAPATGVARAWLRRARPVLGTLVEVGVADEPGAEVAVSAAFAAVQRVQVAMSVFDADSDIGRFNAAPVGATIELAPDSAIVLQAAHELHEHSEGSFDAARGTGRWAVQGSQLLKLDAATRLDLGGIAKGYAVDAACAALREQGVLLGWVNAGGDLRSLGVALPVALRDEQGGGVRPWLSVQDTALATSYFGADRPERLHGQPRARHVSVQALQCIWADGLTKVIAQQGRADAALLRRYHARSWTHPE
jgi:thiamine biosynthesis lipoprotein